MSRVRKNYPGLGLPIKTLVKIFIFAVLSIALFWGVSTLKNAEYFPIRDVKLFGVQHLNHQEVQTLLSPFVNNGFFAVDVERVKEQLLQLPWVDQVMVRRVWPDQVSITINEKTPIALWNGVSLLSSHGDLFSPAAATYPTALPQLIGPAGEQIMMAQYYSKMADLLAPLHFKITQLQLTPAMAWRLTLTGGIKLNIGHKDVLTRLRHFVKVYPRIIGNRIADVEYIDLRYPNGMAVRWKSVT
jgi:cell division protein FtsQ